MVPDTENKTPNIQCSPGAKYGSVHMKDSSLLFFPNYPRGSFLTLVLPWGSQTPSRGLFINVYLISLGRHGYNQQAW